MKTPVGDVTEGLSSSSYAAYAWTTHFTDDIAQNFHSEVLHAITNFCVFWAIEVKLHTLVS